MFNQLKKYLIMLFGISTVEANGIIILFVILGMIILSSLIALKFHDTEYASFNADQRILDSMINVIRADTANTASALIPSKPVRHFHLFRFDPNLTGENQLDSLGIPHWLSDRIIKYRNAGGKFTIKSDLNKIYGMSPDLYRRLKNFIALPDSMIHDLPQPVIRPGNPKRNAAHEKFDLNLADSLQLINIKGIGPALAGRILKYRNLLGGYISVDQLNEVYGLRNPGLENLKKSVLIGRSFVPAKININFAEWKELIHHPYINKGMADAIIGHRDSSGPYQSFNDLKKIKSFSDSIIARLRPYITF